MAKWERKIWKCRKFCLSLYSQLRSANKLNDESIFENNSIFEKLYYRISHCYLHFYFLSQINQEYNIAINYTARIVDNVRLIDFYPVGTYLVKKCECGDTSLCCLSICLHYCYRQIACRKSLSHSQGLCQ